MSRQPNFVPTPGVGLGLGLTKKRKRFDDPPDDDDDDDHDTDIHPSPSAPLHTNDEDPASKAPPLLPSLPKEVSDATVRLVEAMQFQIHALTEKVARVDSLERRCRYLEERCTCRFAGIGGDVVGANGGDVVGDLGENDAIDDGGGAVAASEGGVDAAEASTRALLQSMEKPLEKIRQMSQGIPTLERRYDILEERRMGRTHSSNGSYYHPSIPPPVDNNNNNHVYPHDHHHRLHSLEERCRFLEAKLHVIGPPHNIRTMPPPPEGRQGGVTPPNTSISHPYGLDIIRAQEEDILLTIDDYKKMNRWPLRRNKADIFERDEKLQRLRLFESRKLRHERVKFDKAEAGEKEGEEEHKEGKPEDENEKQIEGVGEDRCNNVDDEDDADNGKKSSNNPNNILKSASTSRSNQRKEKVNKQGIKSCALCASKKCSRKVRWKCGLCQIPLCTKKNKNGLKSCWEIWHTEVDWKEERARVQRELVEKRTRKRGSGGEKEGNGGGDGDEDSDAEDEEEGEAEEGNEKGQQIDEESVFNV